MGMYDNLDDISNLRLKCMLFNCLCFSSDFSIFFDLVLFTDHFLTINSLLLAKFVEKLERFSIFTKL